MRIGFFASHWPPDRGANGIVTTLARLAPALRGVGCETSIIAAAGACDDDDASIVFLGDHPLPREPAPLRIIRNRIAPHRALFDAMPAQMARAVREAPKLADMDLLEIEESFGWSSSLASTLNIPVVVRLHGPYFLTGGAQTDGAFGSLDRQRIRREGLGIAAAAAVSAPSKFALESVRQRYRLALDGARVIPNPAPERDQRHCWRLADCDRTELLFIGRFDRIKGADIALRAFASLAARRPDLRLTFAGPDDEPLLEGGRAFTREEYVARIMSPVVAGRVRFLGRASQAELSRLRARAALLIAPSRIEMFSTVLLESLASGTPTIAARVGGNAEIIRDGVDGVLVEPEDPAALAAAVEAMLEAPERAATMAESGLRRATDEFSANRLARRFVDFYAEVLERSRRPRAQHLAGR